MTLAATRLIPMRKNKGKSIGACLHNHTSYIQNPDKTEQGELVSSYQCSPLTVDEEFLLTKRLYEQTTGRRQKSDVIAYQVRQSFKPGEVTPEEANRIGYEFAERFLKGKHAFIVATHTDRAHIHNHIIYNSTALDGTRKFKNFWLSTFAVQRLSDLICLEHQLSTIEYKPYRERQKRIVYPPKESNRDRLCGIIDTILAERPKDFEVFLQKLEHICLRLNYMRSRNIMRICVLLILMSKKEWMLPDWPRLILLLIDIIMLLSLWVMQNLTGWQLRN